MLLWIALGCRRDDAVRHGAAPPPPAWTTGPNTLSFAHPPLTHVARVGDGTWGVGPRGTLVELTTGAEPAAGEGAGRVVDVEVRGDELWVASVDGLSMWDGVAWTNRDPAHVGFASAAVVARRDGSVALVAACTRDCPPRTTTVFSWDGAAWSRTDTAPDVALVAATETADGRLIAVGQDGWIAEWTGSAWADLARGGGTLRAIAADGDEIVAVGDDGRVVRGPADRLVETTVGTEDLDRVVVGEDGRRWATGHSRLWVDDDGWTEVALPAGDWSAYEPEGDVLLGTVFHDGMDVPTAMRGGPDAAWERLWQAPHLAGVSDLWVDETGAAWIGAEEAIGRWDLDGLEGWAPSGDADYGSGIAGGSAADVLVVGEAGVHAWDGTRWSLSLRPPGDSLVTDVAVAPDGAAFAAGITVVDGALEGVLWRRTEGTWAPAAPLPSMPAALAAFAADDAVALADGVLWRFGGVVWNAEVVDFDGHPCALWARTSDDVYVAVVGRRAGGLVHWDGVQLTDVPGAPASVLDIAGDDTTVAVVAADDDGDDAWTAILRDGAWTVLETELEPEHVGVGGGVVVVMNEEAAWRGP